MINHVPFTDLLSRIVDNRGKTCPTNATGIPLIATNCVKNETLFPVLEKIRYVSEETYNSWFRGHPQPNDLIFVTKGSPGQVCLAPDPVGFCIAQDMVAITPNPERVYPPYLFAALRSPQVQHDITNMHVGTLIPHFKKGDFDKLKIPVPSKERQIFIGDTFLRLSEKIESNTRMNETLEAMAQAIFRDWFVDFGPTRRKQDGAIDPVKIIGGVTQNAENAARLAALFPDAFGNNGLPQGWKTSGLDDVADFLNGLALQKFPAKDGEPYLPVIKIAELRNGITPKSNRASLDVPEKCVVSDGDFLFSWSGSLLAKFWTEGKGALNQHLFKVTSEKFPPWLYASWVWHHLAEFQRIAASKATTMGHIQRQHLAEALCNLPPEDAITKLGVVVEPLVDLTVHNNLENRTLAKTRDLLLPRLISEEITLKEAETSAEAAE